MRMPSRGSVTGECIQWEYYRRSPVILRTATIALQALQVTRSRPKGSLERLRSIGQHLADINNLDKINLDFDSCPLDLQVDG